MKLILSIGVLATFLPLSGEETPHATLDKPVEMNVPITKEEQALQAAKHKKAVLSKMIELFLNRNPPAIINQHQVEELPPDIKLINGRDGMATLIYRCRYVDPEYLTDALDAIVTESGYVELVKKLGSETNEYSQVVIYEKAEKMEELKNILLNIDILQPQVLVEAQVIEIYSEQGAERDVKISYTYHDAKYDTTNTFGFNLDSPSQSRDTTISQGGGFNFVPFATSTSDGSTGQLNAAIRLLNSSRDARILSAPNVIADQGASATITTAEEVPIPETAVLTSSTNLSFKFKQVGVTLKITPKMINKQTVQLQVNPQVRSILRYQQYTQNNVTSSIPVIAVRSVDTRLTVADGDIIVLGGLYNSEKAETLRKMPYIGDIPIIDNLVNGRDMTSVDKQLLFLLKVHIIHPMKNKAFDPETTADEIHKTARIIRNSRKILTNKPASEFQDIESAVNEEAKSRAESHQNFFLYMKELFAIEEKENTSGKDSEKDDKAKVDTGKQETVSPTPDTQKKNAENPPASSGKAENNPAEPIKPATAAPAPVKDGSQKAVQTPVQSTEKKG